ncbi:hypothetical protein Micbo1qcDRAFT_207712 [Microdochium bolleyi]|uniref:Uncharacterized protein n=1 Tax=Microdochium bolleyi TaxID=196109 RepID=A0A136ISH8_9PEZI|nr:hypothetical protein Micbo1qcDRAFT_207712 [Microdochium bolleyi]
MQLGRASPNATVYTAPNPEPDIQGSVHFPGFRLDKPFPGNWDSPEQSKARPWTLTLNVTESRRSRRAQGNRTMFTAEVIPPRGDGPGNVFLNSNSSSPSLPSWAVGNDVSRTWRLTMLHWPPPSWVKSGGPNDEESGSCSARVFDDKCQRALREYAVRERGIIKATELQPLLAVIQAKCAGVHYILNHSELILSDRFARSATAHWEFPIDSRDAYNSLGGRTFPMILIWGSRSNFAQDEPPFPADHVSFVCVRADRQAKRLLLRCEYPEALRLAKKTPSLQQQAMQRVLQPANRTASSDKKPTTSPVVLLSTTRRNYHALGRHMWTAEDTARAVAHMAFATFDPVGLTEGEFFGDRLPAESTRKDCYRYVCLALKDLSSSPNAALRDCGIRALSSPECYLDTGPWGRDRHLLSAVGNYGRALTSFRQDLPSLSPPDVAYGTMTFAVLELLQGNMASRNTIMMAGAALLRPHMVAPAGPRADGAVRYGLHPRYGDDRAICAFEAHSSRFAAASVLSGLTVPVPAPPSGNHEALLPTFHLPTVLPSPGTCGSHSLDTLRRRWNAFQGTLESWFLSRYWAIAVGHPLDATQHLADQARIRDHMGVWQRALQWHIDSSHEQRRRRQEQHLEASPTAVGDRDTVAASLTTLCVYLHCSQIAMTTPAFDAPTSEERWIAGEYPSSSRPIDQVICVPSLARMAHTQAREVGGFRLFSLRDLCLDCSMLPVLSRQAAQQLEQTENKRVAVDEGSTRSFTDDGDEEGLDSKRTVEAELTGRTKTGDLVTEKQLAMLDLLAGTMERAFDEHEATQHRSRHEQQQRHGDSRVRNHGTSTSSSSSPSNTSPISSSSPRQQPREPHHEQQRWQQQERSEFQTMPLRARKELLIACTPGHIDTTKAALRDGVFYAQVFHCV